MALYLHELKRQLKAFLIWGGVIAFMLILCIFLFPQMKNEMANVTNLFNNMGAFTAAFGMDTIQFGEILGFYGIECGNVLGIGGGFFAAMLGANALAKEEKNHTAEFLLTQPLSRRTVVTQKLLSGITIILVLNVAICGISLASILLIGENIALSEFFLIHLAYTICQLELFLIGIAISAFLHMDGIGIGIGVAATFYFLNIIANLSDSVSFLKYLTPFSYAEVADIINTRQLDMVYLLIGLAVGIISVGITYYQYERKDIAS